MTEIKVIGDATATVSLQAHAKLKLEETRTLQLLCVCVAPVICKTKLMGSADCVMLLLR